MDGIRRILLFLLGVVCVVGAFAESPIHIFSALVGLLLMGVVTWEQIEHILARRNGEGEP